jgi:hypothetical protein
MWQHSPQAFPWEKHLPWALASVRERMTVRPEGTGRAPESTCAWDVGASISRTLGTSVTVRTPNVCGRSTAGRPLDIRSGIALGLAPKAATLKLKENAVNKRGPRPRPLKA